jgi:hypothetical protein
MLDKCTSGIFAGLAALKIIPDDPTLGGMPRDEEIKIRQLTFIDSLAKVGFSCLIRSHSMVEKYSK